MRLALFVMVVLLGIDAYAYSGHYTQATVNEFSEAVHNLTSSLSTNTSDRPARPRPVPDRPSPTS